MLVICVLFFILTADIGYGRQYGYELAFGHRVGLFMVAFLICWGPWVIVNIVQDATRCNIWLEDVITLPLVSLQGFINCFVYTMMNKRVRHLMPYWQIALHFIAAPILFLPIQLRTVAVYLRNSFMPRVS